LVSCFAALAADIDGKWVFEVPGQGGATPGIRVSLSLRADGSRLTGTITQPNRAGDDTQTAISEGQIEGDTISLKVSRATPGGSMSTDYKGTLNGDSLELKITRPGRSGDASTITVTARRSSD
jgi:hypothetical protein